MKMYPIFPRNFAHVLSRNCSIVSGFALKICDHQYKSVAEKGFPLRSSASLCGSPSGCLCSFWSFGTARRRSQALTSGFLAFCNLAEKDAG
jgi:hypothetical protein